jgi:dephospho-CoA kinase
MLRVGLTGGIACGKSVVLRRLRDRGIATIDLDDVSRSVTRPGSECLARIAEAFGGRILAADGSLDRKALGALVFADPEARARLNAIVHPAVRSEEARLAASLAREGSPLVVDGALLVEARVHLRFDRLVVVHCPRELQVRRLRARDGLEEGEALARIEAQMPLAEKRRYAHYELETSGTVPETERRADRLADETRALAGSPATRITLTTARVAACLRHGPSEGAPALGAMALLREIARPDRIEMSTVARLAGAPAGRPWYRTASAHPPHPAAVAVPIVLWALARRGLDAEFLAYAVASVARAAGAPASTVATACAFAEVLAHVAAIGGIRGDLTALADEAERRARRWSDTSPERAWRAAVAVAAAHPDDPVAARAAAAAGADADMAGALVGIAAPPSNDPLDAALAAQLTALEQVALCG